MATVSLSFRSSTRNSVTFYHDGSGWDVPSNGSESSKNVSGWSSAE